MDGLAWASTVSIGTLITDYGHTCIQVECSGSGVGRNRIVSAVVDGDDDVDCMH